MNDALQSENVRTHGNGRVFALDFGIRGIRASIVVDGHTVPIALPDEGLSPSSLLSVRVNGSVPHFPSLLERLGEDCPVRLDMQSAEQKPNLHLRDLIEHLQAPLCEWWGPCPSLAVVVSAYATDLQRALLLKAADRVGWSRVYLVNKTTALAVHALQRRPPGTYLSLVMGYGSAEASVIAWGEQKIQVLSYSVEPRLAGEELDRAIVQRIVEGLQSLASGAGRPLSMQFSLNDWMWIRNRSERVRHQLNQHREVILEIPPSLGGGRSRDVRFDRQTFCADFFPAVSWLNELFRRCCEEGDTEMERLDGILVSGGLLMQASVFQALRQLCRERLVVNDPWAQLYGAAAFGWREENAIALGTVPSQPEHSNASAEPPFMIPADLEPEMVTRGDGGPRPQTTEMERPRRAASDKVEAGAVATRSQAPNGYSARPQSSKEDRDYLVARRYLRRAQVALQHGRLNEAVALSHKAQECSNDSRVFRAMIETHLQAAAKNSFVPQTFEDDRRWLLCALHDDGTNYEVHKAVEHRFVAHAEYLLTLGTTEARREAILRVKELLQYVPFAEDAQRLVRQLENSSSDAAQA